MTRSLGKGSLLALGLLGAMAPAARAQQATGVGSIPFETYQLANGLKVLMIPDHTAPVVAVDVWYNVGARNERPGRTGFAHLFEHMMFEGSANVNKGEHMQLVQRAGSSNFNGTTSEDRTNYYEVLPSNRLNLALWLEADRMRSLNVTEQNLNNQREVVKEEKRMRIDNAPYAGSINRMLSTASYDTTGCFAYGHTTIGSMDDLNAASLEDVRTFFRTYYAPNNATVAISGDFDRAQARALVQQYFGDIAAVPQPAPVECANPFARFPTRETVEDPNATLPAFLEAFGAVADSSADGPALELLGTILGDGESSRINQRLVKQERAASTAFAGAILRRGPGVFAFYAIANQGVSLERIDSIIDQELAKVREQGVTAEELQRAKNQYRAQTLNQLGTAYGRAEALQRASLFLGGPDRLGPDFDRHMAVTREDVMRVANKYLVPNNRTVILTVPAKR
ncbi:MAG TPA: pitrilysin family protein [Longimicrobiaceae bacterium]|nr:pitrilysin family protein [Longimicrobiaceae bacterium]